MNNQPSRFGIGFLVYAVAIVGTFVVLGVFVAILKQSSRPPLPDAARIEARRKAAAEVALAGTELGTYGTLDATKGRVRLPVERAMALIEEEWRQPAGGRARLIERFDQFNPPPPPPAPAAPSQFE
jgi:hypothetical protein